MTNDELNAITSDIDNQPADYSHDEEMSYAEAMGFDMTDLDPALAENDHLDNGHPTFVEGCPLCDDAEAPILVEPADKPISRPTGRKNTDHSSCSHPRTKAGRAACRKATAKLMVDIENLKDIHDHEI